MSKISHLRPATTASRPLHPGQCVDEHWHEEHQLVYASSGVLTVSTGRGVWVAPPTRALWVPARVRHAPRANGTTVLVTVGLAANPLRLARPSAIAVTPLLRELLVAYASGSAEPAPVRDRLLGVLLDQLRPAAGERPLHLPVPRDPRLAEVGRILSADPADPRSASRLAAAAGTSARTLARLCRAELGLTLPQWRTQIRLHHALNLLAAGLSVTEVAHRCGWSTASAFIDVFRRTLGHTPGRHRPDHA